MSSGNFIVWMHVLFVMFYSFANSGGESRGNVVVAICESDEFSIFPSDDGAQQIRAFTDCLTKSAALRFIFDISNISNCPHTTKISENNPKSYLVELLKLEHDFAICSISPDTSVQLRFYDTLDSQNPWQLDIDGRRGVLYDSTLTFEIVDTYVGRRANIVHYPVDCWFLTASRKKTTGVIETVETMDNERVMFYKDGCDLPPYDVTIHTFEDAGYIRIQVNMADFFKTRGVTFFPHCTYATCVFSGRDNGSSYPDCPSFTACDQDGFKWSGGAGTLKAVSAGPFVTIDDHIEGSTTTGRRIDFSVHAGLASLYGQDYQRSTLVQQELRDMCMALKLCPDRLDGVSVSVNIAAIYCFVTFAVGCILVAGLWWVHECTSERTKVLHDRGKGQRRTSDNSTEAGCDECFEL